MQVEEVFVEIPMFPNYAVSNYGEVINQKTNRELKPWVTKKAGGKLMVKLYRAGMAHNFFVHRLVAQAFFIDYDDVVEVYHLSENKQDNCVTNLHLVAPRK
jgi:hypothetical protein